MPGAPTRPRHNTTKCAKCRKDFHPGDRVSVVHIVVQVGHNKVEHANGAWLSEEFELAHVMCENPSLEGTLITLGGG